MLMVPQSSEILNWIFVLLEGHRTVFGQERVYLRAVLLVLAEVLAPTEHRVTDLLRAVGLVQEDWSAWYRLWHKPRRFMEAQAGVIVLGQSLKHGPDEALYVIGIDSTQAPRTSQKMEGTSWLKCPRTPAWKVGIHRAQRFVNVSWLTPLAFGFSRAIPLRFLPAFPDKAVLKAHEAVKEHLAGLAAVRWVRCCLDGQGRAHQPVLCLADGSFDKPDFWTGLPGQVIALVRTAKNRALFAPPGAYCGVGRRRTYGDQAPAPQDYAKLRTGWRTVSFTVRGRQRRSVYRVEGPFLRKTMSSLPLMLMCVRGQTWQRAGRLKYREPVYFLVNACLHDGQWTLPLPAEILLEWAWQRWELEVVHREVKSLAGLGDKQCHQPIAAVASVQWSAWLYALLTLAAYRTWGLPKPPQPTAAWYRHPKRWTFSTLRDECRLALATCPDFQPLFNSSPKNWPQMEAVLANYCLVLRPPMLC